MVGGERSTFTAAQGVLNALGQGSKLVGTVGNELNICHFEVDPDIDHWAGRCWPRIESGQ